MILFWLTWPLKYVYVWYWWFWPWSNSMKTCSEIALCLWFLLQSFFIVQIKSDGPKAHTFDFQLQLHTLELMSGKRIDCKWRFQTIPPQQFHSSLLPRLSFFYGHFLFSFFIHAQRMNSNCQSDCFFCHLHAFRYSSWDRKVNKSITVFPIKKNDFTAS